MNFVYTGFLSQSSLVQYAHYHEYWEIICYKCESGILVLDDLEHSIQSGDVYCIPPYTIHYEEISENVTCAAVSVDDIYGFKKIVHKYKDTPNEDVFNILLQIYREYHFQRFNWNLIITGLINILFQYMLSQNFVQIEDPMMEKIKSIIISNLSNQQFDLNQALNEIYLTKNYIRKLFKKKTGLTPLEYLTEKRIDLAKSLLARRYVSPAKIKDIAGFVGFSDSSYFSRVFKKATGISPESWVNQSTSEISTG